MTESTSDFTHNDGKAVHESGHAVTCVVLNRPLLRVSIVESQKGGGFTEHTPDCSSKEAIVEEIAIMLAGGSAADLWNLITNTDSDERRAKLALQRYVKPASIDFFLEKVRGCVDRDTEKVKPVIEQFARKLQQEREIDGKDAEAYIRGLPIGSSTLRECLAGLLKEGL